MLFVNFRFRFPNGVSGAMIYSLLCKCVVYRKGQLNRERCRLPWNWRICAEDRKCARWRTMALSSLFLAMIPTCLYCRQHFSAITPVKREFVDGGCEPPKGELLSRVPQILICTGLSKRGRCHLPL